MRQSERVCICEHSKGKHKGHHLGYDFWDFSCKQCACRRFEEKS